MALSLIKANRSKLSRPERVTLNGRKYLVSSAVLVVPGVLNGSDGPLYYPADEVEASTESWDHVPMVLRHAFDSEGVAISVNTEGVLDEQGLGFVSTSKFDGKLKTKMYFDEEILAEKDDALYKKVEAGLPVELSVGLGADIELKPGKYNGVAYDGVVHNIVPDHVAVLPDEVGACSIDAGCGVNVNTSKSRSGLMRTLVNAVKKFVGNAASISHEEIRMKINQALRSTMTQDMPWCYVFEVYDDHFVFEMGERIYSQSYSVNKKGEVVLSKEDPKEVRREVTYPANSGGSADPTVEPTDSPQEGSEMRLSAEQRKQKIGYIVANCSCWKRPGDDKILNSLPDDKLADIEADVKKGQNDAAVQQAAQQGFTGDQLASLTQVVKEQIADALKPDEKGMFPWQQVQNPVVPAPTTPAPTPVAPVATPVTANEWMASAPAEIRQAVSASMQIVNAEKANMVNSMIANLANDAEKRAAHARLMAKPIEEVRDLYNLFPKPAQYGHQPQVNYFGAQGGVTVNSYEQGADQDDALDLPKMDYAAK